MNQSKGLAARAAVGIIGAALVTGCAAGGTGGSPAAQASPSAQAAAAPVPAPARVLSGVLATPLPVAAYGLTPLQLAQEQYVNARLTQQCMRGYGIDYLPTLSGQLITRNVDITEEFDSRWYGVSDSAAVRSYGYHLPTWTEGMAAPTKLPPVGADVLTGTVTTYDHRAVPNGGCLAEVQTQLAQAGFGTSTQATGGSGPGTVVGDIQSNAFQSAQSDPRVLASFKKWSACMLSYGYHYSTPFTAAGDQRWSTAATANPLEIRTAERDVSCKLRVNLLNVEFAVVSDYQQAALARNASALAAAKVQLAGESSALSRLMSRYGPSTQRP